MTGAIIVGVTGGTAEVKALCKLIVMRHAQTGSDGRLTFAGIERVEAMARELEGEVVGPVRFVCSPLARAKHTAEVLALRLRPVEIGFHDALASGMGADRAHQADVAAIHEVVTSSFGGAESLVVVTHLEVCRDYPSYYVSAELGLSEQLPSLGRAEALVIDCEDGSWRHFD